MQCFFEHQQCHVFYYLVIEGGFAPLYKNMVQYIQQKQQQKQQRQQHKNLLWQFIQLNIPLSRDVICYMIHNINMTGMF